MKYIPFPSLPYEAIYKTYNITQHENLNMDIAWLLCVKGPISPYDVAHSQFYKCPSLFNSKTLNSSSLVISMIMRYMLSHYVHLTLFKGQSKLQRGGEFSHTLQECHGGLNLRSLICKLMSFFTGLDYSAVTIKVDILLLNPTKRKQK